MGLARGVRGRQPRLQLMVQLLLCWDNHKYCDAIRMEISKLQKAPKQLTRGGIPAASVNRSSTDAHLRCFQPPWTKYSRTNDTSLANKPHNPIDACGRQQQSGANGLERNVDAAVDVSIKREIKSAFVSSSSLSARRTLSLPLSPVIFFVYNALARP